MTRIVIWLLQRYLGGPRRSWVILTAGGLLFKIVRSFLGRRETVDLSNVKPGQKLIIEHLPSSHKKQIKSGGKPKRGSKRTELSRWKARNPDA